MTQETLRLGSKGSAVSAWQRLLVSAGCAVNVDGDFGPKTKQATIDWQRARGLVADGVVGPVSWATANGTSVPVAKTSMAPADANAYAVAKRAMPELSEAERQYALTVARGEGQYGLGWAHPSSKTIELSKRYGLTGYEGVGSNNWGADQGSGSAGSFKHVDTHSDGSVYVGTYARQKTPEEGFARMARIIIGGGKRKTAGAAEIRAAINAGDLERAVRAQHANGYFELAPEKYLAAVRRNYGVLTANIGWQRLFDLVSGGVGGGGVGGAIVSGGGLAVIAGLAIGGLLWWARAKG